MLPFLILSRLFLHKKDKKKEEAKGGDA